MPIDPQSAQKPLRKLRKSLKNLANNPSADQVHDVRTRSRRTEATLHALRLDKKRKGARLVELIAPVRKQAGKARDMDVLIGMAASLNDSKDEKCRLEMLEHLGARRSQFARRFTRVVDRKQEKLRKGLKRSAAWIQSALDPNDRNRRRADAYHANAMAVALQHSSELSAWPKLSADNLHPFRLKVKELLYVLELAEEHDEAFLEALGNTKDAIGEWHDWGELAAMAAKVLDHEKSCGVRNQIQARTQEQLSRALSVATNLRRDYFSDQQFSRRKRKKPRVTLKEPVLITTAKMAG